MTENDVFTSLDRYRHFRTWKRKCPEEYRFALANDLISMIKEQFGVRKSNLTKERVMESARQFTSKTEWNRWDRKGYAAAKANGWFEEATAHMTRPTRWTVEGILAEARKYASLNEWRTESPASYAAAYNHEIITQCRKLFKAADASPSKRRSKKKNPA